MSGEHEHLEKLNTLSFYFYYSVKQWEIIPLFDVTFPEMQVKFTLFFQTPMLDSFSFFRPQNKQSHTQQCNLLETNEGSKHRHTMRREVIPAICNLD